MGGADYAVEATSIDEGDIDAKRKSIAELPREAGASPALALQDSVAVACVGAELGSAPEPAVRKWPGWVRIAFLLGAAAGAWGLVIGAVMLLLHLHH